MRKPGIAVITPSPKTSGGARWNYLAAWAWALNQPGGNDATAEAFVKKLYHNVPVLDSGARGATVTFAERGIGDVLLAWENEAYLAVKELGPDKFDIVAPSFSIVAEPPVSIVDQTSTNTEPAQVAEEYLRYLYSQRGPGDRRQALLSAARSGGGGQVRRSICEHPQTGDRRCRIRRLDEGAGDAFRGPRHLRQDLRPVARCWTLHAIDGVDTISQRRGRAGCCPVLA